MKKVLIIIVVVFFLPTFMMVWPYIYNYHIFSLARLKNSIDINDGYKEVAEKFKKYQSDHQDESDLQVTIDDHQLFIYHVNIFDDCQLTVAFSANGKVKDIKYIGD